MHLHGEALSVLVPEVTKWIATSLELKGIVPPPMWHSYAGLLVNPSLVNGRALQKHCKRATQSDQEDENVGEQQGHVWELGAVQPIGS